MTYIEQTVHFHAFTSMDSMTDDMNDVSPVHCKKRFAILLSPAGMYVTNQTLPWPEIIQLFPARESLVSDIQAEDGKIGNLFFTV
jgi:hypothetical protein